MLLRRQGSTTVPRRRTYADAVVDGYGDRGLHWEQKIRAAAAGGAVI